MNNIIIMIIKNNINTVYLSDSNSVMITNHPELMCFATVSIVVYSHTERKEMKRYLRGSRTHDHPAVSRFFEDRSWTSIIFLLRILLISPIIRADLLHYPSLEENVKGAYLHLYP